MKTYYVYLYVNPIDNIPFYVGYGHGNRYISHLKEAKRSLVPQRGEHKLNKIREILRNNKEPEILKLVNGVSKEQAAKIEEFWIGVIGRADKDEGTLVNHTAGGDGIKDWSHDMRKQVSDRCKDTIMVKDPISGAIFRVDKEDDRWLNREVVGCNSGISISNTENFSGYILAKDIHTGEVFRVKQDDPRWITGKLVGFNKGNKQNEKQHVAALKNFSGPKNPSHLKKIGESIKKLKWFYNEKTDEVKRLPENNIPPGFIRVSGPHKKKPI